MAKKIEFELLENEVMEKEVKGDYWHGGIGPFVQTQSPGIYYFTNQRVLFKPSGLFSGSEALFTLDYNDIQDAKNCMVGMFIPTGILVTMNNGTKYKFSVLGRKKWLEFIKSHKA
jgi:hypothetical protein